MEKGLLGQRKAPARRQDVRIGERGKAGTVEVGQDQIAKGLVLYVGTTKQSQRRKELGVFPESFLTWLHLMQICKRCCIFTSMA